jgi:hypothetical protein
VPSGFRRQERDGNVGTGRALAMSMRSLTIDFARLAVPAAVFGWMQVGAGIAEACAPGMCSEPPLPGTSLPADAFAVKIADPAQSQPSLVDIAGGSVALVTTPDVNGIWLARTAAPLAPGSRYTFRRYPLVQVTTASRAVECQLDSYPVSTDFVALAPAPYPTTLGTVTLQTPYAGSVGPEGGLRAELRLSDEALPFAGLLQVTALIDGPPLAAFSGKLAEVGTSVTVNVTCADGGPSESLNLDGCGDVVSLGPGPHGITSRVSLACSSCSGCRSLACAVPPGSLTTAGRLTASAVAGTSPRRRRAR